MGTHLFGCMSNTFFQGGEKFFRVGFVPVVTGLVSANKFSFSGMLRKGHICDPLRKSCTTV